MEIKSVILTEINTSISPWVILVPCRDTHLILLLKPLSKEVTPKEVWPPWCQLLMLNLLVLNWPRDLVFLCGHLLWVPLMLIDGLWELQDLLLKNLKFWSSLTVTMEVLMKHSSLLVKMVKLLTDLDWLHQPSVQLIPPEFVNSTILKVSKDKSLMEMLPLF